MPRELRRYRTSNKMPYSETGIEEFLKEELAIYKNKKYHSKALGVDVGIIRRSIGEIAHNCRFNRQAAELALKLPYVIANAKIKDLHLPVKSKQQERFNFVDIATLTCNIPKCGVAKLTVGFRVTGEVIAYAVTNYQVTKTSLFID